MQPSKSALTELDLARQDPSAAEPQTARPGRIPDEQVAALKAAAEHLASLGDGASEEILTRPLPPPGIRIPWGAHPSQFGELRLPERGEQAHPVVIVLHGGFWREAYGLEHMAHFCEGLKREGIATWTLEYRRLGEDGGGFPGTLWDCAIGAAHVNALAPRYGLDLSRVVIVGFSAGGQLALWLAARHRITAFPQLANSVHVPIRGVLSLSGVNDLQLCSQLGLSKDSVHEFLGGRPEELPEIYDAACPAALLPSGVPTSVVHGAVDPYVPCTISDRYVERARAAGDQVEYLRLEGVGHFALVDPNTAAYRTVVSAVRRQLGL